MAYKLKDHGFWEVYRPEVFPEGYPPGAMFAQRKSDGKDWYDYIYGKERRFASNSVVGTAILDGGKLRMQAIVRDPSGLFPGNAHLIEIRGVDPADPKPWKLFEQKLVDLKKQTFTEST